MSLGNATIVLTGASSGIGAESARVLKEQGATVIGLDRNAPKGNVDRYIEVDLSDRAAVESAAAQIDGPIMALANVAGVPPTQPVDVVMKVNVLGVRWLTELLAPKLMEGGAVVNMASAAGGGWPARLDAVKAALAVDDCESLVAVCEAYGIGSDDVYQFSKECVIVWTKTSWNRWADRSIRVNCISPGPVATPILPDFLATLGAKAEKDTEVIDRPGTPDEIAPAVAFLCDPVNTWINGHELSTDGGLAAALQVEELGL